MDSSELSSICKKSDLEALFLKEIPWEIKRLSFPLLKNYLENKMLVLCKKIIEKEQNEYNKRIILVTNYFTERQKDISVLPYINFATADREMTGTIIVCEDSESEVELKYPGGYFIEMRFTPNYAPIIKQLSERNYDVRMYLERKKAKKVKIVNVDLDRKIENIKLREEKRLKEKAAKYFTILQEHIDNITGEDVKLFEKGRADLIEKEIINYLRVEKQMGTDFRGKSVVEMATMLKQKRLEM